MSEEKTTPSYYAIIPAPVRYDPTLPGRSALLYGEITALAPDGYCWASNGYFAKLYGVKDNTIRTWLAALEKAGHILREDVRDPDTNQILGRRIWIRDAVKPPLENLTPPLKNKGTPPLKNEGENITSNNNIPPYNPPKGERPPKKARPNADRREELERWFEIFWTAYPKKVDKQDAHDKFLRLAPDRPLMVTIWRALERQKRSEQWQERRYIPSPRRWIGKKLWENEVDLPAPECAGMIQDDEEVEYW